LWKRAVPKTIAAKHNYGYVVLIDCSVHSRKPKHTLKAITKLNQAPHCHLVIIDHHPDTFFLAPEMQHPQLSLVLTDVPSCGILDQRDHAALEMMLLGALGDKDPESCEAQSATNCKQIHEAAAEYHRYAIHFSPTPPKLKEQGIYPLKPLWEALAQGRQVTAALAAETLGALPPEEEMPLPRYAVSGSLVVVTERLNVVGRAWYALLEQLMNKAGVPYAAALRVLDGKRGNVLLLTRWQATHLPPVKHFVPESYLPHCLGHPGALWADLEKASALGFLKSVEQRINTFVGTPGNFNPIAKQLTSEILDESIAM